ncbi:hypothetical protein [Nocardia sp. NPDC052566]|uniref:hypothetical protein n=1 Tax=Nocardia sp. NPDC052566 TaxID=3364330 RepID=UPI0037C94C9A
MRKPQCHIHMTVDGCLTFDYRADRAAAELFAKDVGTQLRAQVTIDDHVHEDLPPLPCAELWSPE